MPAQKRKSREEMAILLLSTCHSIYTIFHKYSSPALRVFSCSIFVMFNLFNYFPGLVGFLFFPWGISAEAESLCCWLDAIFLHAHTFSPSVNVASASLHALFILVILLLNLQVGNQRQHCFAVDPSALASGWVVTVVMESASI